MNKKEMSRRRNRLRKEIVDVDPVGVDAVQAFIDCHHHGARLPREHIFAVVANSNTDLETCIMVSERDDWLEIVGASWQGDLEVSDDRFYALQAVATAEAEACGIAPPFSLTFANRAGVFSFSYHRRRHRCAA